MDAIEKSVGDLTATLERLNGKVELLQAEVFKPHTPWYKNIPTIISLSALLFSFGTTFVSYNRTKSQDVQALRSELRTILERLAALPKENVEMRSKYANDAIAFQGLSAAINQENAILVRQAREIGNKLPPDQVSASEWFSVATALQNSYDMDGAKELYKLAKSKATNFNDEIAASRNLAAISFTTGRAGEGRIEYQGALNIFSKYTGYDGYVQNMTHLLTELNWANSEANIGSLDLAQQRIADAEKYGSELLPGPNTSQLNAEIEQLKSQVMAAAGQKSRVSTRH